MGIVGSILLAGLASPDGGAMDVLPFYFLSDNRGGIASGAYCMAISIGLVEILTVLQLQDGLHRIRPQIW